MVSTSSLKGHKDSVLALACDNHRASNMLLSGCEDGTMRLWDLRSGKTSRGFVKAFGGEAVTSVMFHTKEEHRVYAGELQCGS